MAKTICLDSGHFGNYNQSPVVPQYYEARQMWKLHLLLKLYLEGYGFEVLTTREKQEQDLSLKARGQKAKNCVGFFSLHSDGFDNKNANHASIFYPFDNLGNSRVLAESLAKAVADCMGVKGYAKTFKSSNGNYEYYSVLAGARSVGCTHYYIIEHSFHTNPKSAEWLMSDANLEILAKAEAKAIAEYFDQKTPSETSYNINLAFRTLRKGMNGHDVEAWQCYLKGRGIKGADKKQLSIDGDFGINTDYATREFQKSKNLDADGCAGPKTLSKAYKGK